MAANPALFIRIAATVDDLKKNIAEGKVQIEALGSSVERIKDRLSMRKEIQQVNDLAAALAKPGAIAQLTAKQQAAVNAQVGETIEKYQRLGKEVPKHMQDVYDATQKVTAASAAAGQGLSVAFGSFVGTLAGNLGSRSLSAITAELGRMWEASQKLGAVQSGFERLATGAGLSASAMVEAMRRGTMGLVSNLDMMQAANKAMLLGLPVTTESMGTLAEAATKLGRAMGQDATKSLDDLITALGRVSPMILDNLGLTVKVGEANDAYAATLGKSADALTEAEKKLAFYNAAMEAARVKTEQLGDQQLTLSERFSQGWTSITNVVTSSLAYLNKALGQQFTADINDSRTPLGFLNNLQKGLRLPSSDLFAGVKVPGSPLGAPSAAGAVGFDAAAMSQQEKALTDAIQKRVKASEDAAAKAQAAHDKMFGLDKIAAAKALVETLGGVEHITKLTTAAQADLDRTLGEALQVYQAMGIAVPDSLAKTADALHLLVMDRAWDTLADKLRVLPGLPSAVSGANLRAPSLAQLGIANVGGSLPGLRPGTLPAAPGVSLSERLFGQSSQQFGTGLSQTIINAQAGGGNTGKAVGAFVGASLGDGLSSKLATPEMKASISRSLGGVIGGAANMLGPAIGTLIGPLAGKVGAMLSSGIEKFAGNATKKSREELAKQLGFSDLGALTADLTKMGEQGQFLADFGANRIGRNDQAGNESWMKNVQDFYKATNAVLDKYGLSLDEINGKHKTLAESMAADYERLKKLGFGDDKLSKSMAAGLNDAVRAALTSGEAIPRSLKPVLESLIRSGGLSDDLARKLLGIAEPVKRDWRKMQEAAERYGLSVDQLGNGFKAAKLDDLVEQLRADWELLAIPGADINAILAAMVPEAQKLITASKQWGYEIPANMRPLLEKMLALGLLVDDSGEKLASLDGLNFGADLTKSIDDLIKKLGELIDKLTGPGGVTEAAQAAAEAGATAASQPSNQPDPNNTDPYLPDGSINPNGPYGSQLPYAYGGAQAAGGDYLVTKPTMFLAGEAGPEQVSFSGANRAFGTAATVIVEIDGRTLAQSLIPVLPGELRRLRLA